jgi:hypothetical protein
MSFGPHSPPQTPSPLSISFFSLPHEVSFLLGTFPLLLSLSPCDHYFLFYSPMTLSLHPKPAFSNFASPAMYPKISCVKDSDMQSETVVALTWTTICYGEAAAIYIQMSQMRIYMMMTINYYSAWDPGYMSLSPVNCACSNPARLQYPFVLF